ncbi:MAG: hypothetical protein JST89_11710 [Cyanobacteria bacterium SZAS-4]|nr:hypothetical protein [Cyanobacteria bacterium SZAS-4]
MVYISSNIFDKNSPAKTEVKGEAHPFRTGIFNEFTAPPEVVKDRQKFRNSANLSSLVLDWKNLSVSLAEN